MKKHIIPSLITAACSLVMSLPSDMSAAVSWTSDFEALAENERLDGADIFKVKSLSNGEPVEAIATYSPDGGFSTGKVLQVTRSGGVDGNPNIQLLKVDPTLAIAFDQVAILSFDAKRLGHASNLSIDFVSNKSVRIGSDPLTWNANKNDKFAHLVLVANRTSAPIALPGNLPPAATNEGVLYTVSDGEFSEIERKLIFDGTEEDICGFILTFPLSTGETTWVFDNFVYTDNKEKLTK